MFTAILQQLEINETLYTQIAIFSVLYFILSAVYFKPFLLLFKKRHQKTVEDRNAAQLLMEQAQSKLEQYKAQISQVRLEAKQELERALAEAKKEEAALLHHARDEAKKITQATLDSVDQQRAQLRNELRADVDGMAALITQKLLSRGSS